MKRLSHSASIATLALLATAVGAIPAGAQSRPLPQKQISRGAKQTVRSTPEPKVLHFVYGALSSVKGSALVLQTRHGTSLRVDATTAIAAGTYSAPLFVGKIVAVGGYYDAAHVLHAQSVTRLTRLDPSTAPDR